MFAVELVTLVPALNPRVDESNVDVISIPDEPVLRVISPVADNTSK